MDKDQNGGEFLDFRIRKIFYDNGSPNLKIVIETAKKYLVAMRRDYIGRGKGWKGVRNPPKDRAKTEFC